MTDEMRTDFDRKVEQVVGDNLDHVADQVGGKTDQIVGGNIDWIDEQQADTDQVDTDKVTGNADQVVGGTDWSVGQSEDADFHEMVEQIGSFADQVTSPLDAGSYQIDVNGLMDVVGTEDFEDFEDCLQELKFDVELDLPSFDDDENEHHEGQQEVVGQEQEEGDHKDLLKNMDLQVSYNTQNKDYLLIINTKVQYSMSFTMNMKSSRKRKQKFPSELMHASVSTHSMQYIDLPSHFT